MRYKKYLLMVAVVGIAIGCSKNWNDTGALSSLSSSTTTGKGGSMARFTIVGNYLYAIDNQILNTISIANPSEPVLVNSFDVGFGIETIFSHKNNLLIGSTSQIYLFSIENPAKPEKLSTAVAKEIPVRCDPVVANDTVAYATLRVSGTGCGTGRMFSILSVYNIKDFANPSEVLQLTLSEPYGLAINDTVLYVCENKGLNIFSIKNGYQPQLLNKIDDTKWFLDVIPYNTTLICWLSDGLSLYDITDKANPIFVKHIN